MDPDCLNGSNSGVGCVDVACAVIDPDVAHKEEAELRRPAAPSLTCERSVINAMR